MEMENEKIWQKVLMELELCVSRANFVTWLQKTSLVSKESGTATVEVPNAFSKEWLENKFNKLVLKFLREASSEIKEVRYVIAPGERDDMTMKGRKKKPEQPVFELQEKFPELIVDPHTNLNPKYTVESFVVGSSNELAFAAATSIAKNPGASYNPFFIYGGVGLGKTHLIQAVGNKVKKDNPNINIVYLPSERFTTDIVDGIRNNSIDKLKEKYKKYDVLIIDDIQFIGGKEKTQEEFFHIFNELHGKNKQIIISSDRNPQSLSLLEERLRSRFAGGMVADIGIPDYEMRMAILKTKSLERGLKLNDDVLGFLSNNIHKNIRELEGALNIIQAKFYNHQDVISLGSVQKILNSFIKSPKKLTSLKQIVKSVCEHYDVDEKLVFQRLRRKEIALPRQIIMYLLRSELSYSYPHIGEKVGKRDHTTAIHSYEKIKKEIENNSSFQEDITLIKQKIYS